LCQIGETIYSINALPIGGFVKLHGEDMEVDPPSSLDTLGTTEGQAQENRDELISQPDPYATRAFYNYPKWKRIVVLTAGVTMNFLLAVIIISYIFTKGIYMPTGQVQIQQVQKNSPAETAGLRTKDIVLKIDNQTVDSTKKLISLTNKKLGKPLIILVERGQNDKRVRKEITLIPRTKFSKNEGAMGIGIDDVYEFKKYTWYQAPILGLKEAVFMSMEMFKGIGNLLWRLIVFTEAPKDIAGPIGIAQLTGQAVKAGWIVVLQLTGLLSLNLAVVNILPIPALDGGRLVFIFLEKIIGRKIRAKIEMRAHQAGMMILLGLMILVTVSDIIRILKEKHIM